MRLPFGLNIGRKRAPQTITLAASRPQSARSYAQPMQMQYLKADVDFAIYDVIARGMPFVDRAIGTLARMTMPFDVVCDVEATKDSLDEWLGSVNANGLTGAGFWPVWRSHIAQMLQYGQSALEIVPAASRKDVGAVYTVDRTKLQLIPDANGTILLGEQTVGGTVVPYPRQDLLAYSAANSKGDSPWGRSILSSVPFVADIVLRMENAVRQKWQRHGAPSFLVNYQFQSDIAVPDGHIDSVQSALSTRWEENQRARWNQEGVLDFIAATQGTFDIKAITDATELDFQIPYRALVEQIVAALHLPPFMLGLQWSTTERLSQQQADSIIGTVDDYRLELKSDALHVLELVQAYRGLRGKVDAKWQDVNLQDRVETAKADLTEAQATKQKMDNAERAWRNGWVDQEQAAEMAGLEIDGVALAIDMPPQQAAPENPDDEEANEDGTAIAQARAQALWRQYP